MKYFLAHAAGPRLGCTGIVVIALSLVGCVSTPEETDKPFTRTDRLKDAIENHITDDEYSAAANRVQYGVSTGLLTDSERSEYLQRYVTWTREQYERALVDKDYREARKAVWNLQLLARHLPQESVAYRTQELMTSDHLLQEWAASARETGDSVLALYLILRRNQISDLSTENLMYYIDVARELNHDEAVGR